MTPERIAEIRQRLLERREGDWVGLKFGTRKMLDFFEHAPQDITDLLAALSTAHAEGRRQGIEAAIAVVNDGLCLSRTFADTEQRLHQLLPEAP